MEIPPSQEVPTHFVTPSEGTAENSYACHPHGTKLMPHCLIIAGPNGAGKTTFARTFLPQEHVSNFLNADLLAAGLSPLDPVAARVAAGRLFHSELDRLAAAREDFAFESTLSGLTYVSRLERWRRLGYRIEIIYLKLTDVRLCLTR